MGRMRGKRFISEFQRDHGVYPIGKGKSKSEAFFRTLGFPCSGKRITVGGEGPWEGPESRPQVCSVSLEALP